MSEHYGDERDAAFEEAQERPVVRAICKCPAGLCQCDHHQPVVREAAAAPRVPFAGVERYYERLFQRIVKRREKNPPLGTGGDLDCLIAMVQWLWNHHVAETQALREALAEAVPTNWTDPLLTGPDGIGQPPYSCQHIERLLRAVKARIDAALAPRRPA
jgi:hypothetical protein